VAGHGFLAQVREGPYDNGFEAEDYRQLALPRPADRNIKCVRVREELGFLRGPGLPLYHIRTNLSLLEHVRPRRPPVRLGEVAV
jgi:hypothetical protein